MHCRSAPSLSAYRSHGFINSLSNTLFETTRNFATPQHCIPFPHCVCSDVACAPINAITSVIKGRSCQVDLQHPQAPWMLPAGWSCHELPGSITGSPEPGGTKMHQKPLRRQKDEHPALKVGFCSGRLEESLLRAGWPHGEGKMPQTVLKAIGSAAGHTGRTT